MSIETVCVADHELAVVDPVGDDAREEAEDA